MTQPQPAAFSRAVIALSGAPSDAALVKLVAQAAHGSKLMHGSKPELVAVHVVEIDWTLPIDADVAGRSEEAMRVLDVAEAAAESAGVRIETVLLQARDVGAAIVDEAVERSADLLVLPLAYRTRFGGDFAIGRTVPYVLKNAPMAVWVVRDSMPGESA